MELASRRSEGALCVCCAHLSPGSWLRELLWLDSSKGFLRRPGGSDKERQVASSAPASVASMSLLATCWA